MLESVKFSCTWRNGIQGNQHFGDCQFQLGPGPCGRNVTKLEAWSDLTVYTLKQTHDDGSHKIFRYPLVTIVGRIEEEYGNA